MKKITFNTFKIFAFLYFCHWAFAFDLWAQSTPGLGGVFTESEKVIWLRADDLGLVNNDLVDLWPDASGNQNDAVQSAAGNQPVFIEDGGSLFNHRPIVRFNGSSHFMSIANSAELNNMEGLTILMVMKLSGTGTQAFLTKRINHNNNNRFGFLYHDNRFRFDVEGVAQNSSGGLNTSSSNVLSAMFDGSLSGNNQFVFRNGNLQGSRSNSNLSIGSNNEPVRLGRFNDGDNRFINGDVAEVLMYRAGLNNAQRLIVENALAIKYGIDLGVNALFTAGAYNQDVIGVGTTDGLQKHTQTTGGGGALYLAENDNSFDDINEFVFAGHDGAHHDIVSPADIHTLQGVEDRWNRVWRIERRSNGTQDAGNTSVRLSFDFQEAELTPNYDNVYVLLYKQNPGDAVFTMIPTLFASVAGNRATFHVPDNLFSTGYYTLGRYTDDASEFMIKTWTSQTSGDWNQETTWRDQYGNPGIPNESITKEFDNILIRNGHTITITQDDYVNNDLLIQQGGVLRINETRGHLWGSIRGEGRMVITGNYFPDGNAQQFIKPDGGTTEYRSTTDFSFTQHREFNHLVINLEDEATSLTLVSDLTVNGNFHIDRGTFYVNDDVSTSTRNIWVGGNMRVASNPANGAHVRFFTGSGDARHFLTIRGNFTANAETRFCNLEGPSWTSTPSNGYTEVIFNHPTQHQLALINATTVFYRIEIDKGVDDTYALTLRAAAPELFFLWGRNNFNQTGTPPNRTNPNALGLLAGTVVIGDHIHIARLRSGAGTNYDIDQDARIKVDGGDLLAPAGQTLAIVVYGTLTLKNGYLEAMGTEGVTIREFGTLEVNGGIGQFHIVRTSVIAGIHRGAYVQTGGTVTINGTQGETTHFRFSLPFTTNSFTMTGGTLNIGRPKNGGAADMGGILIAADQDNILVTGGTVNAIIDFNKSYIINSSAPFYNLNLIKTHSNNQQFLLREYEGGGTVPAQPARPLRVINKLELHGGTTPAILNLNGHKAIIQGDLVVQDGAQLMGEDSHLSFTGNKNSIFDIMSSTDVFQVDTLSLHKDLSQNELVFRSDNRTPLTEIFRVNSFLKVEKGFLDYRFFRLNLLGDLEIHDQVGDEFQPGRLVMQGESEQNIFIPLNNSSAFMGHLEIDNPDGVKLQGNSFPAMQQLTLTNGVFDIQTYGLRVRGNIHGSFDENTMIATAGNNSDGGLTRRIAGDGVFVFPVGTHGDLRYTPLEADFVDVTDPFELQINPVDMELSTLAPVNPGQALDYYWRVRHNDPATLPFVKSYLFQYASSDLPDPLPAEFVPGKIVDLERYAEKADNFSQSPNHLRFDQQGNGFPLEEGFYTAAHPDKFAGSVRVFYSRGNSNYGSPASWHNASNWSFTGHNGPANPEGATPGAGDLVQIGYSAENQSSYHALQITENTEVGGVHFLSHPNVWLSRLLITDNNINVNMGTVSGEGSVAVRMGSNTANLTGDFGDFADGFRSEFIYQSTSEDFYDIPSNITVYPNLRFERPNGGLAFFNMPDQDLLIKGYFWINRNIQARLSTGNNGDITILRFLRLGESGGNHRGDLMFMANGNPRKVEVYGDLRLEGNIHTNLFAENNSSSLVHRLMVRGDIIQSHGKINLYRNNPGHTSVVLELAGQSHNVYTRTGGDVPNLYQIVMNKGHNQNYRFRFENSFNLYDDASGAFKPIELQNGILELAHGGIEVNLNTGNTHDFEIPSSSGLVIRDATAHVNGQSGILLNGLLRLDGEGSLLMQGGNAYIEYGSSGTAILEIHDDAILNVGSHIRRPETFDPGILKYLQTGGTVTVGMVSAPAGNRGVFEVLGTGSSFRFTGGDLIIARGHNGTEAALVLDPSDFLLGDDARLQLGHPDYSPAGNVLSVRSVVTLPDVTVNGSGNFTARLRSNPLTIRGDLHIMAGSSFDTSNLDLTLEADFVNEGTFIPGTSSVYFKGNSQVISGNTTFYNLVMDVETDLSLDDGSFDKTTSNILVTRQLTLLSGSLNDMGNTIELRGNFHNEAAHNSSQSQGGLLFAGSNAQILKGEGSVGRIELNNNSGLVLSNSLTVNDQLIFTQGVLDIQGYRLTLGQNSTIAGSGFGPDKFIRTNGTISDAGVRFFINGEGEFLVPLGVTGKYTPVIITAVQNPGSPFVDIVPLNYRHVNVTEPNNLNFHWKLESNQMASFAGNLRFRYLEVDVDGDDELYYPAKLVDDSWVKIGESFLDENANVFDFPFDLGTVNFVSEEYTAGSDIPDRVLRFRSNVAQGAWNSASSWVNIPAPGEDEVSVPESGPFGQIVEILPGHTIAAGVNQRIAYRTLINGTLDVGTSFNHYLGEVSGSGTLYVEGPALPVGKYEVFAAPGGGTFEYGGSGDYTIDPNYFPTVGGINSLVFSGSGDRILPAANLLIYNDLEVRGTVRLDNEQNENSITLLGNLIKDDTAVLLAGNSDQARIIFNGNSTQQLQGDFTGLSALHIMEIENAQGVQISGEAEIRELLELTEGLVFTTDNDVLRLLSEARLEGSSFARYVSGPLQKEGTGRFVFPVGGDGRLGRIAFEPEGSMPPGTILQASYIPQGHFNYGSAEFPLERASSVEHWSLESVGAKSNPNGRVRLYYEDNSFSGITIPSELLIGRYDDNIAQWINQGQNQFEELSSSSGWIESELLDGLGFFTFATNDASINNNPLPIELIGFTARVQGAAVLLEWATASEVNNDFFTLERSRDGVNFEPVGYVQGAGNSNRKITYDYLDSDPFTGISYYRLKQTDFDGSYEYSSVVAVQLRKTEDVLLQVYPNPVQHGQLNIRLSAFEKGEMLNVILVDMHGRMLLTEKVYTDEYGYAEHRFNQLSGLPAGMYFVVIQSSRHRITERIIIR